MSGPELCPKCKGLHYKNAPCIVRAPVAEKVVNNTNGTKPLSTMGANPTTNRPVEAGSRSDTKLKRRVGRPRTITDMASYKAQKQREYRAKLKAQKEMGK